VENHWKKVVSDKASDVVAGEDISSASLKLLEDDMSPEEYIRALSGGGSYMDAIRVMSRTLPPREAVWWACVCARQSASVRKDKSEIAALKAAESWVYKPSEKNRLKAFERANECQAGLAGWLSAMAAVASAGNLPLADGDHLEKLEDKIFAQVVDGAVMTSSDSEEIELSNEKFQDFLDRGADIACGGSGKLEKSNTEGKET